MEEKSNTNRNKKIIKNMQKRRIILVILTVLSLLLLICIFAWTKNKPSGDNPYRLNEDEVQLFQEVLEIFTSKEYPKEDDAITIVHHGSEAWFIQLNGSTPEASTSDAMATLHFLRQRNTQQNQVAKAEGLPNVHSSRLSFFATSETLVKEATPYMIELAEYDGPLTREQAEAMFIFLLGSSREIEE